VLSIVRRADGRTNLPKPIRPDEDAGESEASSRGRTVDDAPPDESAGGAWKLEAQRVLLVDGAVRFHAEAPPGGEPLDLSAEGVLAEVKAAGGGLDFTCIIESAGRRGAKPLDLGQVKFAGRADGVEDLSQVLKARVTATLDAGDLLRAEVNVPTLRPVNATVRANAAADVARLLPLLPKVIADRLPPADAGRVELSVTADYSPGELRVGELTVRASTLRIRP
jgi:hypothetical protein